MNIAEVAVSAGVGAVVATIITWYFGMYYAGRSDARTTKFEFQVKQTLKAILLGLNRQGAVLTTEYEKDGLPYLIQVGDEEIYPSNVTVMRNAWWNHGPVEWLWDLRQERRRKLEEASKPLPELKFRLPNH